jgi:hypothetical protein
MTAAVAGKWVSDDDEKIPLEFLKDGTAKVGFFKEKGAEARVIAWGEALIIHRDAVVERLGIGDYRPCVPAGGVALNAVVGAVEPEGLTGPRPPGNLMSQQGRSKEHRREAELHCLTEPL